ncbi:MAG: hypothetical protein ACOX8N_00765, partial [Christensenellales bacterium]
RALRPKRRPFSANASASSFALAAAFLLNENREENHKARPIMLFFFRAKRENESSAPGEDENKPRFFFQSARRSLDSACFSAFAGLLGVSSRCSLLAAARTDAAAFGFFVTTAGCGVTAELFLLILFFRFFRALMPEFFAIRLSPCANVHSRQYAHHNVLLSKCQRNCNTIVTFCRFIAQ